MGNLTKDEYLRLDADADLLARGATINLANWRILKALKMPTKKGETY
jgi:hypothetical protein